MLAAPSLDGLAWHPVLRSHSSERAQARPAPDPGVAADLAADFFVRLERIGLRTELLRDGGGHRALALGGERDPYGDEADAALTRALLTELKPREDYVLELTTGSPRVLRDLSLLALLDRQHSVAITYVLSPTAAFHWDEAALSPEALDLKSHLHALARLAGEGLTTRLLLRPRGSARFFGQAALAPLLAAADAAGVIDVRGDARARGPWLAAFERLRLEWSFPRMRPGRG